MLASVWAKTKRMRIFVTGSGGQLARCLAEQAISQKQLEIFCAGRPDFDLLHPSTLQSIVIAAKPDIIVNAAAYTAVDKAESEPDLAFAINRDGAAEMARIASQLNIPIIQISTDYVFSGQKIGAYVETDETGPLSAYGKSKLEGEIAVRGTTDRHAILRTSWVYSPFGNNFVKTMLRLAQDRKSLNVVADQIGCPTSAHDLATATIKIARTLLQDETKTGTFHTVGAGIASWSEFASEIFRLLKRNDQEVPTVNPIPTAEYPTPAKRPMNSVLNCKKLKETFGIEMPLWQNSLMDCMARL